MELMPGYKQTEVGVIPEVWEVRKICEVCTLVNGRGFKPHEWGKFGLPIIRIQNLNGSEDFNYYSGDYNPKILVENGQLLFAWSGSRGTSFGPYLWDGGQALLNYHTWKVAVNESKVATSFFFHALRHLTIYIEDKAHGASALVHTQKGEMEQFFMLIPPLPEQSAIAAALSDVDALIRGLDQFIAKKRDLKQAAMQQLLTGKQRLPGFTGEWELKRLGDIGATYGGLTGKTKADFGNGSAQYIPFLNVITNVVIDPNNLEWVRVSASEGQHQAQKGDLFFNGSSETPEEVGMCSVLLDDFQNIYLNSFCFGFRLREAVEINGLWLAYFFRSSHGRVLLYSLAQGATRYNLSKTNFLKLEIALPEPDEQAAIATVLADMDAEIAALEQRRDKTRDLKQGMMQELLTGRIRLV